jgi:hypothetical protein
MEQNVNKSYEKPIQRISYNEKISDDNQWGKDNIDYHIAQSTFPNSGELPSSTQRDINLLYNVYNGRLPDSYFNYVKNPMGSKHKQYSSFPARIRSYPIIRPNIDLIYGEYNRRPHVYSVENIGEDGYNSFLEKKKGVLQKNIEQHFINEAASNGVKADTQQVATPQEVQDKFVSTYSDLQAIRGQKLLKAIEKDCDVLRKIRKMFKDWLIAGESYSFKNILFGDLIYDRVSPTECDYDKSPDIDFIEDGGWFTRRRLVVFGDILDYFRDELEEKQFKELEDKSTNGNSINRNMYQYLVDNTREHGKGKIEWIHVAWKSQVKVGILSYPDPLTGQIQTMEVTEDYKVNKAAGETIEWQWGNEWWEGHRIKGDIYLGIRPIPVQRNEVNNFSKCKGPYNGVRFSDTHAINISPLELCLPFEIMHYILKYRLELTIAKNKGKIALLDVNTISNKDGWTEEKTLYYGEAMGFMFLNRNQMGVDKSWNQYTVLDMDLLAHIDKMQQLIEMNKAECDQVLGINPQRKGQIEASAGVGNTQQGIFQSSVISDIIFSKFEDFVNKEYQGFLDYSKFLDGIKRLYRNDDLSQALLDMDEDYMAANLNVVVTNSSSHTEKLAALKSMAQAFAQNKGKASTIAEIIDADNMARIKQILKEAEASEQQLAQQAAQSEQEAEQAKLHITAQYKEMEADLEIKIQDHKYDREEELAKIKGDYQIAASSVVKEGGDAGVEAILDVNGIEDRNLDREVHYNEIALKNKELDLKAKADEEKNKTEKYKADKTLEVAKENKPPKSPAKK